MKTYAIRKVTTTSLYEIREVIVVRCGALGLPCSGGSFRFLRPRLLRRLLFGLLLGGKEGRNAGEGSLLTRAGSAYEREEETRKKKQMKEEINKKWLEM
jgi:hypothetical protein